MDTKKIKPAKGYIIAIISAIIILLVFLILGIFLVSNQFALITNNSIVVPLNLKSTQIISGVILIILGVVPNLRLMFVFWLLISKYRIKVNLEK